VKNFTLRYNILEKKENCVLTLHELNKIFEKPEFNISKRYAVYLDTMFMCALYSSVLPISIFWSILTSIFNYWVDKWNFLRKKVIYHNISANVGKEMVE